MGVDTKALLTSNPSPLEVLEFIHSHEATRQASLQFAGTGLDFFWMSFKWQSEDRQMSVFPNGLCMSDYKDIWPHEACFCSIGHWGSAEAIMHQLAQKFDGFYLPQDTSDEWVRVK